MATKRCLKRTKVESLMISLPSRAYARVGRLQMGICCFSCEHRSVFIGDDVKSTGVRRIKANNKIMSNVYT
jgi:hypothetical protein